MKKPFFFAVAGLLLVVASLAAAKALQIGALIDHGKAFVPPPAPVTTAEVKPELWSQELQAVGTLSAVQGVTIAPELAGKVAQIAFDSGAPVHQGTCCCARTPRPRRPSCPARWPRRTWPGSTASGPTGCWPRPITMPRWRPTSRRWPRSTASAPPSARRPSGRRSAAGSGCGW